MARRPRIQPYRGIHHVFIRGVDRRAIYCDESDRLHFQWLLGDVLRRHAWRCLAFCQMTTHYHLVVETTLPDLAVGIKRLNQCYAQAFNRRHDRKGHLFESRYSSVVIEGQAQLLTTLGYVHLNPARAGITVDPADWPWCSFAQTTRAGGRGVIPTRRALELTAPTPAQAARRLSEHVYERLAVNRA